LLLILCNLYTAAATACMYSAPCASLYTAAVLLLLPVI